jgi:hypothetical protein
MTYSVSKTISVSPGKLYKISGPGTVDVYYSGTKILGSGANNYFIANDTTDIIIQSSATITGSISITEVLRSYYNLNDGQGGTLVYQPYINKWVSIFSFIPESLSMVSNRLVTFKNGLVYIHDSTQYNTWYSKTYDSVVAFAHNEAGNTVKVYDTVGIEGDVPDRLHVRTESPNVQSSDLVASDFRSIEGVWYAAILRDRLSPNTGSSDPVTNLYKGDKLRGDIAKFMIIYNQPTSIKQFKFFNINFDASRGQTV